MYGWPPRFAYGGGAPPPAPPPQQQQQQQPTIGANFNFNEFLQKPNDLQNLNNMFFNPNTSFNPNNVPFQSQNFQADIGNYQHQNPVNYFQGFPQPQFMRPNGKEALEKIDREVVKARRDILASGDNVSAWKVSQAVCLALKVDSWESLGFQMQQVPSLHDLIVTEGKINSFIHCFVGVRRITTLHDLELAICENEGIGKFAELDLGPLVRHPLAAHYFSVNSDIKDVFRITSEEIISCLHEFMTIHPSKAVKIDELLDFIAEKRSLTGREKLNVRIQNLGRHIAAIRKAEQSENITMMKHVDGLKEKFGIKVRKRPIFSSQKKKLDDRFNNISERVKTFSGSSTKFCGKHTRFTTSSDEDDSSSTDSEGSQCQSGSMNHSNLLSQNLASSDRVSSCPYPSVAEELVRLGLKHEVDNNVGKSCSKSYGVGEEPLKKKRKAANTRGSSVPRKLPKRDDDKRNLFKGNMKRESYTEDANDSEILSESTMKFVATWKAACCHNSVDEVLDKMLSFYKIKKKKKLCALFSSDPFAGLLDIALKSIKSGLFDSMYDTFQAFSQQGTENGSSKNGTNYVSIEVDSCQLDDPASTKKPSKSECGISIDDIIKKVSSYFEPDSVVASHANATREKKLLFLRKLCRFESWLIEQFSVKDFESFGYGDILTFMERHLHLNVLQKLITDETSETIPFEACMLELQLDLLFSQASAGAWENGMISKQKILELLRRQFPSFCFKSTESNLLVDYRDMIREKELNIVPKCVLFSATMLKEPCIGDSLAANEKLLLESTGIDCKAGSLGSVTTKDAIEVLLRAPMLTDLGYWSHWDIIYAPSLGPLVLWLLNEVNIKELLCLVTKSGKIIRLDHSATLDSFLEVLLKGSSSGTALKLLSLLALYGGERNAPLRLLKCHAYKAFQVLLEISLEKDLSNAHSDVLDKLLPNQVVSKGKRILGNLSHELNCDGNIVDEKVVFASRFILDCLSYVPAEFCGFAASVLLSGFLSSFRDAPSAILSECNQVEQRMMLHDVGFSLGIVEWINDYQTFCSTVFTNSLFSLEPHGSKLTSNDLGRGARISHKEVSMCHSSTDDSAGKIKANCNDIHKVNYREEQRSEVPVQASVDDSLSELNLLNSSSVIESIRRDEFGLDLGISATERKMLKKQHARLGRALQCLSHELYSQDSHFLLELVQNADDNIYPQNAEPSLVFVLQEKGIVVMNNEIGFSAENIRALCDVGNSTKRGQSAGYIGKKGIGFKSVFRITDAPEIHSNGFHIKFDITEGQIGFVLPTVVPPCDTDFYSGLLMSDTVRVNCNSWRTCIVLPFKETLSDSFTKGNIISMFSDLHPSLLLFLHQLKCIIFRDMLTDSLVVMKKEVLMDGIIKVSLGKEKMYWFVVSQNLQSNSIRPDVQSTEISVAFTLEETDDGGYAPHLTQQPVFAFLPLRTYGLKFILQGDFDLPSSREEVDGDSAWNQWLLSEFPGLFVGAERAFCDLPCFQRSPGKAVTAFMSFVPLLGEVQGFFSCLPRMIISKLHTSNCLLLEGDNNHWVPPCKVLRNWTEEARVLLPDRLLQEHLGLGFLNKDIVLPDSLARALGIEDYGPKTLLQIISSLSNSEYGLKLVGFSWLSSWMNAIYLTSLNSGIESELILKLRKIPFVPLSDGQYRSVDRGAIWLHFGVTGLESENDLEAFPKLYAKLRTVNPQLFSAAAAADKSCLDKSIVENVTRMLLKVGVQRLSGHEIVKVHILPAISDTRNTSGNTDLMIEYLSFIMFHMQSGCRDCFVEREWIMDHLRNKALILTNYGYKQLTEVPIHFNREYGNQIPLRKLLDGIDFKWHEVDTTYLKHPITKSLRDGLSKWRSFFLELNVTDFVQIVQSEKYIGDLSLDVLKDMMLDRDITSAGSVVKDWESMELVQLLSYLSSKGDREKCKYLLEILDTFWDSYFSEKVVGYCNLPSGERKPFKSSLVSILQNVRWMVSMADNDFNYAKDLFHDCEAVRSILGSAAPYVVPKVKNQKLIVDLGLKSQVRLDDILMVLTSWRESQNPIRASISQMLRLYTFIWNEMTSSKQKTIQQLSSGPFIFVPLVPALSPDDVVTGSLLSPKEVYWHDTTGSIDRMKLMHPKCVSDMTRLSFSKMLCNFYPTLHDFFVNECGVEEIPPSNSYVQILLQLSTISVPSEAATTVFHVFSKWADCLTSGSLKNEDAEYLRESFLKKECTVLPTEQDKWVSLHPSFGLICWSDDENLRNEFKHHDSIDLLYFGNLSHDEKEILETKVSTLFRRLGIPALSEVVSREAIYYGATDSSSRASLINWALPYAQRYIFHMYLDKYLQQGGSKFEKLRNLQIIVVEKLFYRNVVKKCEIASRKRIECSCLLQGNILYATRDSDSHSIFMELSHLLFGDAPDLHMANFLHMITTMVEAGSTEEQTEFFILNSQKVPKLPIEEPIWSISIPEKNDSVIVDSISTLTDETNIPKSKRRLSIHTNWPPADWRTAPGFKFAQVNGFKTQASCSPQNWEATNSTENMGIQIDDDKPQPEMNDRWTSENAPTSTSEDICLKDIETFETRAENLAACFTDSIPKKPVDSVRGSDCAASASAVSNHISLGTASAQTMITGRLGEFVAFKYFEGRVGQTSVNWVNEANESGLPYDLVIGSEESNCEFIEVKATKSGTKNWFEISTREWQFAVEKGESFSIAHVILLENNTARVTIYKNPVKLRQLGKLRLAILIS